MPHECGTSKPCQSAQTASSERAQCVSGMAHPVERSILPKGHRAISNYRRYRFGLMGLISVVLMNTAEKRLRMRQPYCNSIANLMRICSERFQRLKMAVKRSDFIVRLYSQISSAKINMSF